MITEALKPDERIKTLIVKAHDRANPRSVNYNEEVAMLYAQIAQAEALAEIANSLRNIEVAINYHITGAVPQ